MQNFGMSIWVISNHFHLEMVRPKVNEYLAVNSDDYVLDIACGNGNYSEAMTLLEAKVLAIDYSPKMIELAVKKEAKP